MKKYEVPLLEEDNIELEDIIATSAIEGGNTGDKDGSWNPSSKSW